MKQISEGVATQGKDTGYTPTSEELNEIIGI
jgi:hypothetical protein